jgi:hypothetical protein
MTSRSRTLVEYPWIDLFYNDKFTCMKSCIWSYIYPSQNHQKHFEIHFVLRKDDAYPFCSLSSLLIFYRMVLFIHYSENWIILLTDQWSTYSRLSSNFPLHLFNILQNGIIQNEKENNSVLKLYLKLLRESRAQRWCRDATIATQLQHSLQAVDQPLLFCPAPLLIFDTFFNESVVMRRSRRPSLTTNKPASRSRRRGMTRPRRCSPALQRAAGMPEKNPQAELLCAYSGHLHARRRGERGRGHALDSRSCKSCSARISGVDKLSRIPGAAPRNSGAW